VSWRSVIVYWVLAVVIGAHVALAVSQRTSDEAVPDRPVEPIITVASSTIDSLSAERDSRAVALERSGGRWLVSDPIGLTVSNDLVDALIDTLSTIPPVEILTEKPDDLAQYGLAPPEAVLRLASAGEPVATIELGRRNPTRTAVYARMAREDRVYLIGLNAQYYLELIYEQLASQSDASRD